MYVRKQLLIGTGSSCEKSSCVISHWQEQTVYGKHCLSEIHQQYLSFTETESLPLPVGHAHCLTTHSFKLFEWNYTQGYMKAVERITLLVHAAYAREHTNEGQPQGDLLKHDTVM